MKKFPIRLTQGVILTLIMLLLAGCRSQSAVTSAPTQGEPEIKTTDVLLTPSSPESPASQLERINSGLYLDPAVTQDADSLKISQFLYEGLVRLDANGEPTAGLAESWVISDDQLDYIFTLRPGMTFSDGTPITPDVIIANFDRWFDPQNSLHGQGDYAAWQEYFLGFAGEKDADERPVSPYDGIQKVDQNTILIHLNRAMPELLTVLAQPAFAILDPEALSTDGYGQRDSAIVSSGPYLVKDWSDAGLQLSPNPEYWGEAPAGDLEFGWQE